ncbi:MAG TPA: vWA domain-containing protein [Abditibacteriaceae bacterium]|jgi:Mg-chelatase subunit ChlD
MKPIFAALAAVTLVAPCALMPCAHAQPPAKSQNIKPLPSGKAAVEIAFVLDTTGSMGGLIDGAKAKIWSIVNDIASAKPTPNIKIGFVAYRDKGDDYVTQVHDLEADLDKAFSTLQTFQAGGGGDTPEHVSKGLAQGVDKLSWSRSNGNSLYQVIFLVGDCPPHTDYNDGFDYKASAKEAAGRDITVNTVRCGTDAQTEPIWQNIAALGGGKYFSIAQDGGMTAIPTPYDGKMGALADKLEGSTLAYDANSRNRAALSYRANAALPAASKADRAEFNAKSSQVYGGFDLATQYENKQMDGAKLRDLKKEELPAEMQKLPPAEREAFLQKKLVERKKAQTELAALRKQRDAFLQAEMKKRGEGKQEGFDALVKATVRQQAARRGLRFTN